MTPFSEELLKLSAEHDYETDFYPSYNGDAEVVFVFVENRMIQHTISGREASKKTAIEQKEMARERFKNINAV